MKRYRLNAPVITLIFSILMCVSCSKDVTGPEAPNVKLPHSIALDEVASQISVTDMVDGTVYTLDVPSQEIRMSDGRILGLDSAQTQQAIASFYAIQSSDPVASDMSGIDASYVCSYERPQWCRTDQTTRLAPPFEGMHFPKRPKYRARRLATSPSGASAAPSPIMIRRVVTGREWGVVPPTSRMTYLGPHLTAGTVPQPSFDDWAYADSGDPCTDIATDAYNKAQAYFNKRTSWIREVWPIAVEVANEAMKRILPPGTAAAAAYNTKQIEQIVSMTSVNIMAVFWNSYGCSTRTVTVGPVYLGSSNNNSSSGGSWTCGNAPWRLSFDGGQTWHQFYVYTCVLQA